MNEQLKSIFKEVQKGTIITFRKAPNDTIAINFSWKNDEYIIEWPFLLSLQMVDWAKFEYIEELIGEWQNQISKQEQEIMRKKFNYKKNNNESEIKDAHMS